MLTTDVETIQGSSMGIMGPEMMGIFERQARRFEPVMRSEDVTKIDFTQRPFAVTIEDEPEPVYRACTHPGDGSEALSGSDYQMNSGSMAVV